MKDRQPADDYFLLGVQSSRPGLQIYDLWEELQQQATRPRSYLLRLTSRQLTYHLPKADLHEGWLHLWGVINRILKFLVKDYCQERGARFEGHNLLADTVEVPLNPLPEIYRALSHYYPPAPVLKKEARVEQFLAQLSTQELPLVAELFVLALQQLNPALKKVRPLYDDAALQQETGYHALLDQIDQHLYDLPGAPSPERLWQRLKAPLEAAPNSLEGQLHYLRTVYGHRLPQDLLLQVDNAFDLMAEVMATRELGQGVPIGFGYGDSRDPARFTIDAEWMPRTVLLAKSIHVWLDQLSRRYQRSIYRLDQIPDEELDRLQHQGFTALWLIGCWQRSEASRRIKHLCGSPDAHASAYSLASYRVADDLGGDDALHQLEDRCHQRGLRLACDVVPNHTGLDSDWLLNDPDDFIQLDHPPYPGYRFTGQDLSPDPAISLRIEDGYFNRSDAAVVFEHRDHRDGRVRYIYHGNDGTHTPWNDTAQLDYLQTEVREKMIRVILDVARRFSVIRFDAAMTLAKKHFQRLWYPQPGGGAGVPSRADHWRSREDFEAAFPEEFWRQVVDRIQQEVPDTLLIAEAFWLMEGYFVRTLGMHRVYNSAFMNMLKTEDNAKYRQLLKDTLIFNPGILQRFVNFLSNPDEETAIDQFGSDDKYFGAATLLATMPGLPMFAHGQIEGLKEKYGMEFRSAKWDEPEDQGLIERHQHQIFPLLRQRYLFSGADDFQLFDFGTEHGVDENVYAYVNGRGDEAALVVFNNRWGDSSGWLHQSLERIHGDSSDNPPRVRCCLGEALKLANDSRLYRFRDLVKGLEYLRTGEELHQEGFCLELGAFQHHVFWQFRHVQDGDGRWRKLWQRLQGHGCPNLEEALDQEGPKRAPLPVRPRETMEDKRPLKVLFVASEVTPLAKTGGLADVVAALPQSLQAAGNPCRILMPAHPQVREAGLPLEETGEEISLRIDGRIYTARILESRLGEVPVWLLDQPELFDREGLYGTPDGDYEDNPIRFSFFCRAALELCKQRDYTPDVMHVHDWQAGLVPVLLRTDYADDPFFARMATVMTIHNLGYTGAMGMEWLERLNLHPGLANVQGMEFYGSLSPLKGGIGLADRITTVSPTYRKEVCQPEMGQGMDGLLRHCGDRFSGILNGLDIAAWNPATDKALPEPFSITHPENKARCKRTLQEQLGLPVNPDVPLMVMITRLDRQKGIDLVLEAWQELQEKEMQFVVLGTGNRYYMDALEQLKSSAPERISILLRFSEQLSRQLYSGADLFLMPSFYEPCGLSQMIALRYGVVPIVRRTGGLADTVTDIDRYPEEGTGLVFDDYSAPALLKTIDRALELFEDRKTWPQLVERAMAQDFSWDASAEQYLELYRNALASPFTG